MPSEISKKNIARLEQSSGGSEKLIQQIIQDEIGKSERTLSQWKRKLVKFNELYKMVQNQRHYEGLAKIFVPEILRAVETVVGNLYKIVFGQDPWFEYEGESDFDEPPARAQTQLTSAQMEENQFKLRTMDSFRQMAIAGLTVRKLLWDFNQVTQKKKIVSIEKQLDPITGKSKEVRKIDIVDSPEVITDNWTMEPVDLLSFHISDITTPYHNLQKARWVAEQILVDKQWIRERVKKDWFVGDQLDEIEETNAHVNSEAERYKRDRKQTSGYTSAESKKGIEIIERWGLLKAEYVYSSEELKELELEKDDMVESVLVLADRKYFLKLEPNPFWHNLKPYVACPYVALESELPGLGVTAIGESLQEELNDTRNQTMDNKSLILMNMWLRGRSSGIKKQDLRIRPLGVIDTNDMNGLTPLRPPVLTGVGVNIEGVIKDDLRQSVGASSNLQGIAQSGIGTATESSQVNAASMGRLSLTAQQYAELILKPALQMIESMNYQFFDTDKTIRILGERGIKFQKIKPDDIVGNKKITIRLSTDLDDNPGIKRQQLLQFLTIMQQIPPEAIQFHWRLLDRIYKSFFPDARSLEDIYQAPPSEEELLQPDEEFELMRQGVPVKVKVGDNDAEHIQSHESNLEATKFALSPAAFKLNKDHIVAHYQQLTQKQQQANQAAQQQQMAMMQQNGKGNKLNAGQIPNASPFTNSNATQPSDLRRNMGG